MAFKPRMSYQLNKQTGMGRPGGAASKGSKPPVMKGTAGSGFAAMESTLLKGVTPDPKALSGGGTGRQFFTQAAGGDMAAGLKHPNVFKLKGKSKA